MTQREAKNLARQLSTLKPKNMESEEGKLWQAMVFAVANHLSGKICNQFEYACSHYGIWMLPNEAI